MNDRDCWPQDDDTARKKLKGDQTLAFKGKEKKEEKNMGRKGQK